MLVSRLDRGLLVTVLILFAALQPISALAHEHEEHGDRPRRVPDEVIHRATAVPDRIVLTWTGDPATSQAVTWRTDASVTAAVAEITEAGHGPGFVEGRRSVDAQTTALQTNLGQVNYHTVEFVDLQPGTKYAYRVGDGENWSAWMHFTTAWQDHSPFSFIYFGDAQNNLKSMWSRVIREAYSDAPKAAFILHAGDLVNVGDSDAEWGEWFDAGGWVNAMIPSVPVPGNHEYMLRHQGKERKRGLSPHWRPQFALPLNGPAGLEETAYYFDYGNARIIALNSNEQREEQAAWLEEVLRQNTQPWTIVTFHHPVHSAAKERDNPKIRQLWKPILSRHGVDLVLQGHDHTYARSAPGTAPGASPGNAPEQNTTTGLTTHDPDSGTVYVVSVSGPKMYDLDREDWMRRAAQDTQLYQIIHIDGDTLRYEARTAAGVLYDSFELRKRIEYREGEPVMEERLGDSRDQQG